MNDEAILTTLLELASSVGITVRSMPGGGDMSEHLGGSLVRVKGKEILFLDDAASAKDQIAALAAALRDRGQLQERFLPPEVRMVIEES